MARMSFPKILALTAFLLFSCIALAGWWKHGEGKPLSLQQEVFLPKPMLSERLAPVPAPVALVEERQVQSDRAPPMVDRTDELFRVGGNLLPIVETISYKSHVPWLKGRQAWLSDYAAHYATSRHFIARSLNGRPDYIKQELPEGARFNVFRQDMPFQFHLVVDTTRYVMLFYYRNNVTGERELIKSYRVGLGRPDASSASNSLTPRGAYLLGDKIAVYQPTTMGPYKGNHTQLIRIFGTRWIPFTKEIAGCTAPARGYGIHGVPWVENEKGELVEDTSSLGRPMSDGCIRLATADIEELFAIIVTKPTVVELVSDYSEATFPTAN